MPAGSGRPRRPCTGRTPTRTGSPTAGFSSTCGLSPRWAPRWSRPSRCAARSPHRPQSHRNLAWARRDCLTALARHRRHRNPIGEAKALDSLGYIAHHTGDYRQAIAYYEQAVSRHRALGNTTEAVNSLDRLGHPYVALGQHELAGAVWREALEMYQDQSRDTDAARVQGRLSRNSVDGAGDYPFQRM
ncbi:tetratricopeptide repeat protein [Amycolatopsis sp. CA-128772]|uniref:tetratricopeptide repeat protein n=1 Tax=Amycolatopsis sp. CA-128772 TaxID=2073159 RepID=UPI001E56D23F|nr:tetratricopeptide repeat protein [Amycolatopsis sp. CA-128772]